MKNKDHMGDSEAEAGPPVIKPFLPQRASDGSRKRRKDEARRHVGRGFDSGGGLMARGR